MVRRTSVPRVSQGLNQALLGLFSLSITSHKMPGRRISWKTRGGLWPQPIASLHYLRSWYALLFSCSYPSPSFQHDLLESLPQCALSNPFQVVSRMFLAGCPRWHCWMASTSPIPTQQPCIPKVQYSVFSSSSDLHYLNDTTSCPFPTLREVTSIDEHIFFNLTYFFFLLFLR